MNASKDELEDASTKLHEKTPAAMNTMLEKQPRAEAFAEEATKEQNGGERCPSNHTRYFPLNILQFALHHCC